MTRCRYPAALKTRLSSASSLDIVKLMSKWYFLIIAFVYLFTFPAPLHAATYYVSPTGNDNNTGLSEAQPWASFDRAVNYYAQGEQLQPGDTLILLDGVYNHSIYPQYTEGTSGNPITIKAKNDGKAIIDGQGVRTPVSLDHWAANDYFIFEGIVAKNSSQNVYHINGSHNIFRRTSGYNAWTDGNSFIYEMAANTSNNLIEDCVAAGTGRILVLVYNSSNNIVRRCFIDWMNHDSRQWHDFWPWGEDLKIYNASNNIAENIIGYGSISAASILVIANDPSVQANNNQVLGSIAINGGINRDGSLRYWGSCGTPEPCGPQDRPQPTQYTTVIDFDWPGTRSGFELFGSGERRNDVFRDILAWRNAGLGFSNESDQGVLPVNSLVDHATMLNNGIDGRPVDSGQGKSVNLGKFNELTVTNSRIEGTSYQGTGARLTHRYVDGQLTTQPLWPWPMEDRIKTEFAQVFGIQNLSVTCEIGKLINQYTSQPITNIDVNAYCQGTVTPGPFPSVTPTSSPPTATPTPLNRPCQLIGDTSCAGSCNNVVNILDYTSLLTRYATTATCVDMNADSRVNILDYTIISQNFGRTLP